MKNKDLARVDGSPQPEEQRATAPTVEPTPTIAQHSPLPWVMRAGVCRRDHPDTSADVHGRDGQFIADCGCHDRATANAALIVKAVNRYLEAEPVSPWLPIASAPKDGNAPVLLWIPGYGVGIGCWLTMMLMWSYSDSVEDEPTYWMPLPDAPVSPHTEK